MGYLDLPLIVYKAPKSDRTQRISQQARDLLAGQTHYSTFSKPLYNRADRIMMANVFYVILLLLELLWIIHVFGQTHHDFLICYFVDAKNLTKAKKG